MSAPIPMLLWCPGKNCGERHIDEGEFATKPHHTHACQSCGMVWRPAIGPTVGVQFLPGFKDRKAAAQQPQLPCSTRTDSYVCVLPQGHPLPCANAAQLERRLAGKCDAIMVFAGSMLQQWCRLFLGHSNDHCFGEIDRA